MRLTVVFVVLFAAFVEAQNSATTKRSYFTVDANAERTSTKDWWGGNVDTGVELTTSVPPGVVIGGGTTNSGVQVAGIVPVESATMVGTLMNSTSADDGNSTQNSSNSISMNIGVFIFLALLSRNY